VAGAEVGLGARAAVSMGDGATVVASAGVVVGGSTVGGLTVWPAVGTQATSVTANSKGNSLRSFTDPPWDRADLPMLAVIHPSAALTNTTPRPLLTGARKKAEGIVLSLTRTFFERC
jgi:hypothetical protein